MEYQLESLLLTKAQVSSLEVALTDLISTCRELIRDLNRNGDFLEHCKTKELPFLVLGRLHNTFGK